MTNRIDGINVGATQERQTEPGRFGQVLRVAASGVASGAAGALDLAAPFIPGGSAISAAVHGVSTLTRPSGINGSIPVGPGTPAAGSAGGSIPGAGGGEGDILAATKALQEQSQTFNLQYLQLQENMQKESREFTALSNVMKVKHDSAKAAINNIH